MAGPLRLREHEILPVLANVPDTVVERARQLRDLILATVPHADETVAWNSVSYHDGRIGGRIAAAICGFGVRNGVLRLGFVHGAELPDPGGLLEEATTHKREMTIESLDEPTRRQIAALIRSADEYVQILNAGRSRRSGS